MASIVFTSDLNRQRAAVAANSFFRLRRTPIHTYLSEQPDNRLDWFMELDSLQEERVMRKVLPFLIGALLVAAIAVVNADEPATKAEEPWFDMENCSFCKNLLTDGLIDHLGWSNHVISTGMMSVTTIEPGWEDNFEACMAKMEEAGQKLMAGEQLPMCNYCQSYGMIYASGKASFEEIETDAGHISLTTSTDPETIAMIQTHAQKTIDAFNKMMEAEAAKHEGHEH
jgi:hypothetical protein